MFRIEFESQLLNKRITKTINTLAEVVNYHNAIVLGKV